MNSKGKGFGFFNGALHGIHSSTGRVHHFLTGQMAVKSSSPDFVGDELKGACHEISQIEEP